ncbi:MAG: AtpZ/AtpI family protein [Chloroflexota bacterium]|nr:AtpZ/AtpI family protein [Chloroflexota bacterium]
MRDDNGLGASLALAAQFGFAIACPMVAFIGGGAWLDNKLGVGHWLLFGGILLGVLSAVGALYQVIRLQDQHNKGSSTGGAPYKVEKTDSRAESTGTNRADKRGGNGR